MTTTTQPPKGEFVVYENQAKKPGDKTPTFKNGRISVPGSDRLHTVALWPTKETEHLEPALQAYTGVVEPFAFDAAPRERIAAKGANPGPAKQAFGDYMLEPFRVAMFPTGNYGKKADNDKALPSHFGYYNPGGDAPVVEISGWYGEKNNAAHISGNTNVPYKDRMALQPSADQIADMAASHDVVDTDAPTMEQARGRKGTKADVAQSR
jgi:hypothetical protein